MSIHWIFVFDGLEYFGTVNSTTALLDDGIADLADQNDETSGCVVVLGVVPDKQDGVHDGHKHVGDVTQIFWAVWEIQKQVFQGWKVFEILISFFLGNLDLFLEFTERSRVGALVLFEELKNLFDAFGV